MRRSTLLFAASLTIACGGSDPPRDGAESSPVTTAVAVGDRIELKWMGDLWMSTWAADDALLLTFGDGTGQPECIPTEGTHLEPSLWGAFEETPGCWAVPDATTSSEVFHQIFCAVNDCNARCYPTCPFTDSGLVRLTGRPEALDPCTGSEGCVISTNLPSDPGEILDQNDKPSSILALTDKVVLAGHRPPLAPTEGYLAVSTDGGVTWSEVDGSPWTGDSPFRDLMFIQQGKANALADDGYVYALGFYAESVFPTPGDLYLARVPQGQVDDYSAWTYLSGFAGDEPRWGSHGDAIALAGMKTRGQGGAIYHPGVGRYLYLTTHDQDTVDRGALYEAPRPWGPWTRVDDVFGDSQNPAWDQGGYIPGLVPKYTEDDTVYFTLSGSDDFAHYTLTFGVLQLGVGGER